MKNGQKLQPEDLDFLNRSRAFRLLLDQNQLDFQAVLEHLKYEKHIRELQVEMIKMQTWVARRKKRLMILFEGRDFAGKRSAIAKFSEHLNPRNMRTVALPKPKELEKRQWYFRRYIHEFPLPGEIVFFDRSWYNRAIVEPVNKFCSRNRYNKFMSEVNQFEEMIMNDGIQLIKFYFSITKEEQARRLKEVASDPLTKWKLTPLDERAQELWEEYTKFKDRMMEWTDRENSPWIIIHSDNLNHAHIEAMEYVLGEVIYK